MITIFYIGCGTGSTDNNFKLFLYKLFTTQYFWADKVSHHVTYYKYHTPQEMIDGLKYKQKDRWSMVTTKEQNENFLNQKSIGFGFSYSKLEDNSSIVVFVRINSPADKAGLKRGDILLKVDDKNLTIENIKEATLNIDKKSKFLIYRPTLDKNLTINILAQEYSLTHQDIGQMDMYVRMYDEEIKANNDNPTIGIVLCSETDNDIARYSILKGNEQLFASKYKLYLPTEEELKYEIEREKINFKLQFDKNEK